MLVWLVFMKMRALPLLALHSGCLHILGAQINELINGWVTRLNKQGDNISHRLTEQARVGREVACTPRC